jgi:hypothetical protein
MGRIERVETGYQVLVSGVVRGLFTELIDASSYALDLLNRGQITHLTLLSGTIVG